MPAGADLLYDRAVRKRAPLGELVVLVQARRLLVVTPRRLDEARRSPALQERGCFDALGAMACLFDVLPAQSATAAASALDPAAGTVLPGLRLREDTVARVTPLADGALLELVAARTGPLDYAALSQCHVERLLRLPLGLTLRHDAGLEGRGFPALRFEAGQVIYRKELRGAGRGWPAWVRPTVSARLACR